MTHDSELRNSKRDASAGTRLLALSAAAFISTYVVVDPDLWGHLRFGLDTLAARRLTMTDPYSFTQDVPWINHEWLSELVLAGAWRAGGAVGIVLMKAALLGATFALLADMARRHIPPAHRWWMLAVAIIAVTPSANTIRPQLWTLAALAYLGWTLWGHHRFALVPVLFLLWANLHGGWIVGLGVATSWLVGRFLDDFVEANGTGNRALLRHAAVLAVSVAATLVNPYGVQLWRFLASTVGVGREITEWRPLWQQASLSFAALWLATSIMAGTTANTIGIKRVPWAAALPTVWLSVMSVFVARLVPLFAEVTLLASAGAWALAGTAGAAGDPRAAAPPGAPAPRRGFLVVDGFVAVLIVGVNLVLASRCLPVAGDWVPDLEAAAALAPQAVRGRLILPFDWGQFAIWHFGPRLRVSIDGRRETVYSDATVRLQAGVASGTPDGLAFVAREQPEYLWLPTDSRATASSWLEPNGYRLDVRTSRSFIARRADLPALTTGHPFIACFP